MQKRKPFQFKKFTIEQTDVAMPVTTDACILGAYAAPENSYRILDIGAGTGLLSLMLAQRYPQAKITALELHEPSFDTLKTNIENSVFRDAITPVLADIRNWENPEKFDAIVWNPPFFENQLRSENDAKKMARHTDTLSYELFAGILEKFLEPDGSAWLLIPSKHKEYLAGLLENAGWKILLQTGIKANAQKDAHVWILQAGRVGDIREPEYFITWESAGKYSPEAHKLLHPYYLYL